jgi:S1-C subfamily serine protease
MKFAVIYRLSQRFCSILAVLCWLVFSISAQQGNPTTATAAPAYLNKPYAYLGVYLGDAPDGKGALVGQVVADSPAAKAGLRANDVILRFDKTLIESAAQIYRLLGETPTGSTVTLSIQRADVALSLPVQLGERRVQPGACQKLYAQSELAQIEANRLRQLADEARQKGDEKEAKQRADESAAMSKQAAIYREDADLAISEDRTGLSDCRQTGKSGRVQFGLNALPLSEQLAQFFKVKESAGWLITEVKANSLAEQQGLKAGDCLLKVNGKRVATLSDLNRLMNREGDLAATLAKGANPEVTLAIVREGKEQTLKFNLP